MSVLKTYVCLGVAVVAEVVATSALQASNGFSRFWPSILTVLGYAATFFFMSLTLRTMPVGIVYAIWSGIGIVLISVIAWFRYRQPLDGAAVIGIALIMLGVVVINVFSRTTLH